MRRMPPETGTSAPQVKVAVCGPRGRMGQALLAGLVNGRRLVLSGTLDRGQEDPAAFEAEVIVDFTSPAASVALARRCAERGGPALVIGTTGFDDSQLAALASASERIAMVRSGNFSIGLNLLLEAVERLAARLPAADWDIEVTETHHRHKRDAPSGTALMLGEAAARGRQATLAELTRTARGPDTGVRMPGEIGLSSLRGGGIVGEHRILFAGMDEVITLGHSALSRTMFVQGALTAATWVADRSPGDYNMQDVLGLSAPA